MSSSATSICSGLGDDPPIAKRVVDHRPRHLGPASGERLVEHDDVDRHSDVTERAAEPDRFPDPILDRALDHEEVGIAPRVGVTTSPGSEQDDARRRLRRFGQRPTCTLDDRPSGMT
jgi:hypothetical protein